MQEDPKACQVWKKNSAHISDDTASWLTNKLLCAILTSQPKDQTQTSNLSVLNGFSLNAGSGKYHTVIMVLYLFNCNYLSKMYS